MIEQKNYTIKKYKGKINFVRYLGIVNAPKSNDCYFYFHKIIFDDITKLAKMKTLQRDRFDNSKITDFYVYFTFGMNFYNFTYEYFYSYNITYHDINITHLQNDFLYFLLYLYNLLSNENKLEMYLKIELNNFYLTDDSMIRNIERHLGTELNENNKKQLFQYYLKEYLIDRRELQ